MSDLAAFLLARIAEDEVDAKQRAGLSDHNLTPHEGYPVAPGVVVYGFGEKPVPLSVLFNPARVLAECEAKRRIVDQLGDAAWSSDAVRDHVLGNLALPYVDHEDYRDEWRP